MIENYAKAQFVNYLLKEKYDIKEKKSNILSNNLEEMNGPKYLYNFNCDATVEELNMKDDKILDKLENDIEDFVEKKDEKFSDLIFGVLYCSSTFAKESKSKDFKYKKLSKFYKDSLVKNKKILSQFHKKTDGKINISLPEKIVTRFPPEANGYLHIGHAKAAIINSHLAKNGKLIVRFDDTNPMKEKEIYEDLILEDLKSLGITEYTLLRTSDHFDEILEYAKKLIILNKAFVDDTELEEMRELRMKSLPSKNRDMEPEKVLEIFNRMIQGLEPKYCLRAKICFDSKNTCLRDPTIYRSIPGITKHDKTGDKYKIYPIYDFSCPIVDSLDGVTLALRSNEYHDRNIQYKWFLENLNLKNKPKMFDFSRLNFENTVLSKRKIKFLVDNKFVSGWDDPRLATIRGIKRRGLCMNVLNDYILSQGSSQKTSVISWDKLWNLNKRYLDPITSRILGIPFNNFVTCKLISPEIDTEDDKKDEDKDEDKDDVDDKKDGEKDVVDDKTDEDKDDVDDKKDDKKDVDDVKDKDKYKDKDYILELPRHKKNLTLGNKKIFMSNEVLISQEDAAHLTINEEITLMHLGNVFVKEIVRDNLTNSLIKSIIFTKNYQGDYKLTKQKVSWIAPKGAIVVKLFEFGNLLKEDEESLKNEGDLASKFNKDSKKEELFLLENEVSNIQLKSFIQIERVGFYYYDSYFEFNLVPFTKQKRVY